ncbi:hypothetical protein FIU94_00570 [Sulfitobacter sp. THAF37]|uniref:hypothetical protein n=1 Tax=Sulfitobacter sp. THAF37 TaxID=2587855 RepID=UPI001268D221|nr:hypothetical protein [Sulfitobacter sp. THAF37]QFT57300.1 hypothetical protein FIU94_00570 [Sulfitobacter sp. THAF37]
MNRLLLIALVLIVGGGLVAGFSIVGGPQYARMERHDRERARDLRSLADYHRCVLAQQDRQADGASVPLCSGYEQAPDLVDPATGAPYRYAETGPRSFRVCATFETDAQKRAATGPSASLVFDGDEGCVVYGGGPDDNAAAGATLNWTTD